MEGASIKRTRKSINIFNTSGLISENKTGSYRLTYFQLEALAEPIRFLFSYGGIEFEDVRLERESWPQFKSNMPFGQVPVLEYNGKVAHQSVAIARFVAKQVKLMGDDDWEDLEIDAIVDTINDLKQKIVLYHYQNDEEAKKAIKESLFKQTLPYYLDRLDATVKANNGHLAIEKLTWADLYFTALLNCLNFMAGTDLLVDHPNLAAMTENVLEIPNIKAWIEKRPKTEY